MSLLQETVNNIIQDRMVVIFEKLNKRAEKLIFEYHSRLDEGVTDNLPDGVDEAIAELGKRSEAAGKAIGLLNKLPQGESRTLHRRRIWANFNRINALSRMLSKQLEQQIADEERQATGMAQGNLNLNQKLKPVQQQRQQPGQSQRTM